MDERRPVLDVIEERSRVGPMPAHGAEPAGDPLGFFRGLGLALAASLPVWIGLLWGVRELS
jgi:hypothetical protein